MKFDAEVQMNTAGTLVLEPKWLRLHKIAIIFQENSEEGADISVMFPENCLRKREKFKLTEIPYLVIP